MTALASALIQIVSVAAPSTVVELLLDPVAVEAGRLASKTVSPGGSSAWLAEVLLAGRNIKAASRDAVEYRRRLDAF